MLLLDRAVWRKTAWWSAWWGRLGRELRSLKQALNVRFTVMDQVAAWLPNYALCSTRALCSTPIASSPSSGPRLSVRRCGCSYEAGGAGAASICSSILICSPTTARPGSNSRLNGTPKSDLFSVSVLEKPAR